jgi:hypothetical protein
MWLGRTRFDAPREGRHENQYGGHVHQELNTPTILSSCGLFVRSCSTTVLPGIHIPGGYVLWCQVGHYTVCPYIIHHSNNCRGSPGLCTTVHRLFWDTLGDSSVAWIVQSIITYWIVGGCYRRYVDKIGRYTILLLSSIPYHWIGTMGRCHNISRNLFVFSRRECPGCWR